MTYVDDQKEPLRLSGNYAILPSVYATLAGVSNKDKRLHRP
jgi:hypothetical protein